MKQTILTILCGLTGICFGTWDEVLDQHQMLMEEESLILKQYHSWVANEALKIADPKIKSIPIDESNEELIDLRFESNDRLQMLPDPSTPFEGPIYNSGYECASKIRATLFRKLQQMVVSLDEMAPYFGYKPGQIEIRVFEGLRDLKTQNLLFQNKMKEIARDYPHLSFEEIEAETSKWVSPTKNNVPVHSTGAAIDIRLWDREKNDFVDMGPFGVIWGANPNASTFSNEISDEQKQNRLYCLISAERAGLVNYSYEYWHFSTKDRYAAFWENKKKADYGSISL